MKASVNVKNLWLAPMLVLLMVFIMAGCSNDDDDNGVNVQTYLCNSTTCCNDAAQLKIGNYVMNNNQWGYENAGNEAYSQCIFVDTSTNPVSYGWTWSWPRGNGNAKAYPEIMYGWKPWRDGPWANTSTEPSFPQRISHLKRIVASYSANVSGSGIYNLAFDLWITSASVPYPENITREVMIWVDKQNWTVGNDIFVEKTVIDGEEYSFYRRDNHGVAGYSWTYLLFVKTNMNQGGSLNIDSFVRYLKDKNHISESEYLANVEFGTELVQGQGQATISNYSINVY